MFTSLFALQLAVLRHRSAPLRLEREQFLQDLQAKGASRNALLQSAGKLVYVVRYLNLTHLRPITSAAILRAGRSWLRDRDPERVRSVSRSAIYGFTGLARRFLKFHGYLVDPPIPPQPFADQLKKFDRFLVQQRGLSPGTVESYGWHAAHFFSWFETRHKKLSALTLLDVDRYMARQSKKWKPWTMRQTASTLRILLRYAKMQRWCCGIIPEAIRGPSILRHQSFPAGPSWVDVQRLIRAEKQNTPGSTRVKVLLLLFAMYGLRTSEATGLLMKNIDWKNKTFTLRRAKNYTVQRFPIFPQFELAVKRYLELGRPNSPCNNLLVSLRPPHGPLRCGSVSLLITYRMKRLGIQSVRKGPVSLRHACATELLKNDMSLQEIADFLGHRDCLSVGVYAKHDFNALKRVAAVDLCERV